MQNIEISFISVQVDFVCIEVKRQQFLAHKGSQVSLYYTHAPASVRRPSVRRPSFTISKIFSSETAWPIKAKLHVEHP